MSDRLSLEGGGIAFKCCDPGNANNLQAQSLPIPRYLGSFEQQYHVRVHHVCIILKTARDSTP